MSKSSTFASLSLIAMSVAAAGQQVQRPVPAITAARRALSTAQAHQLSQSIALREGVATQNVDPNKVAAIAAPQARPVNVTASGLSPAPPPSQLAPASASAQVQVVPTSAQEEQLLTSAIGSNNRLRAALSVPNSSLITLPGIVRVSSEGAAPLQLKPFIFVNQPLQRDSSMQGMYKGELLVGVSEIVDSGVTKPLPTPLLFQIVGAAMTKPANVLVASTSPPLQPVEVWLRSVEGAIADLRVVSMFNHDGTEVAVPVAGELDIDTGSRDIAGLGVEATKVTVSLSNVPNPAGTIVTLHVDPSGYLDQTSLKLDSSGTATTQLRSGWLGTAHIQATAPGFAPVPKDVTYTFPLLTIIASIIGGLLGAGVSLLTAPIAGRSPLRRLAGATLFGVLVVSASLIGINLLPYQPVVTVGGVAALAISAIAAWLGPSALAWRKR